MTTPPRAVRRRTPARPLILAAAARIFARDGLAGATTRAIAQDAGVNEVTLFRLFGTKEHLIEEVVGSAFRPAPHLEAPSRGSLRSDLEAFARAYEELLLANLPLVRTMIGEIHRHALCEKQALRGIFAPMRASLVARLQAAVDGGEARLSVEAPVAADILAGSIFAGVLRRATLGKQAEYGAGRYRSACVEVFLSGVAR